MTSGAGSHHSLYAVGAILDRVEPLIREIPGVIAAKDPEFLHRMRVASRRLRMALRLLGQDAGLSDSRAFFKQVRSVTRTLGVARDFDVQICWLDEFAVECAAKERVGVKRLALRLTQMRERVQPKIIRLISCLSDAPVFTKTIQGLRAARLDAQMSDVIQTNSDLENSTRVITLQLDSVLQHASSLLSSDANEAQHRMRIEVKHLRYAMEIFRDLYGDDLDEFIILAKKLQGMLGELHDADVWIDGIVELKERERNRTISYYGTSRPFARLAPGYEAIAENRTTFRASKYEATAKFWKETERDKKWLNLRELLLLNYRERAGETGTIGSKGE